VEGTISWRTSVISGIFLHFCLFWREQTICLGRLDFGCLDVRLKYRNSNLSSANLIFNCLKIQIGGTGLRVPHLVSTSAVETCFASYFLFPCKFYILPSTTTQIAIFSSMVAYCVFGGNFYIRNTGYSRGGRGLGGRGGGAWSVFNGCLSQNL
jgi:hypothetical protein